MRKRNPTQFQRKGQILTSGTVESDVPLPSQPTAATTLPQRKRVHKRKATTSDVEIVPPSKKAKRTVEATLPNRDVLPACGDHPAIKANLHPGVVRFTSLCSTTAIDIPRYLNRLALSLKNLDLSRRMITQMSTTGIPIYLGVYSVPLTLHRVSMFANASNVVVCGGEFYCAGRDILIALQGESPPASFRGSDDNIFIYQILIELQRVLLKESKWYVSVPDTHLRNSSTTIVQFTAEDVIPKQEIYEGRGYRVYSSYSTTKVRMVKVKLYTGSRAKEVGFNLDNLIMHLLIYRFKRCSAAAEVNRKMMYEILVPLRRPYHSDILIRHPNVLHQIGVSPQHSELSFLVFDGGLSEPLWPDE